MPELQGFFSINLNASGELEVEDGADYADGDQLGKSGLICDSNADFGPNSTTAYSANFKITGMGNRTKKK